LKKKHVVYDYFCDICGELVGRSPYVAPFHCELCGKEVCQNCARFICAKPPPKPCSGGSALVWTGLGSCDHKEEMVICKACTDALKLSLRIAANKKRKKK